MTDGSFIYIPRNGEEMIRASPPGTKMFLYSDLVRRKPKGKKDIFKRMGKNNIVLVQNPDNMQSGHWESVSFAPEKKEVYFFSSYGGKPDEEKVRWLPKEKLKRSNQLNNIINDGLKQLKKEGWIVYYNDFPYQHPGDKTATCGIWTSAFLNSGMNPDDFARKHSPVQEYYRRYFYGRK